ncbi:MAG: prepilin-type N-terminal cleavage/methylation domain-containing protein [Patescibacteria group bacterium]|nr:prepilin-type N-terminal cleavage/methylation domain-containing protein [Patescibacteria group bacterium]
MKTKNKGFTLVEVLIVASITVVLGLAILGLQYIISQNQVEVWRNYLSVDEANSNISTMARELRNAKTAENGAYALERAADSELIFYSDYNYDGRVDRIRYTLSGNSLIKGVIEPTGFPVNYPRQNEKIKVVAENVRNGTTPIFYYYNENWPQDTTNNPLNTPTRLSDTKLMRLYLEINPKENNNRNYILETYIQIRSLKENL